MLSALTRHQEAKTKALAEDSIGYGAARGLFEQPSPLDLSNPAKLTAAFSERQKAVDILNARGLTRGGSAVSVGDGAQVAQIWGTGDAKSIRTLTDAMAQGLTPKTLASTLSSGKVMSAVKGAAMSLDPAKHVEAMRALDLVEGSMGLFEVERSFGKDAVDRLQDWQSRVSYFSEKETAEWLKDRNDPSWSKRMKPVIEKGHKEARAFTFDQIASGLGVGFFGADAPTDDLTKRKLVEDFETIFADRFAVSQDAGSAKEQTLKRMQRYWGESQANNGRLMYLAPESHLPEINGGHDWIADDLKAVAGAQGFDVQGAALIADRKTESAVQAREGPGYLISVTDPDTGESDLLQDKQGRPLRWVPDPSAAQTKSLQSFEDDRQQYRPVSREDALDQWLKPLFTIGPVQ